MTETTQFGASHITEAQADKFIQHNEGMDTLDAALAEASPFAPDNVQNLDANGVLQGLTFGYLAGRIRNDNVITSVVRATILLTLSSTNYIEVDSAGTVTVNQVDFTSGWFPLHEIITDATDMTSITDKRAWLNASNLRKKINIQTGTTYIFVLTDAGNTIVTMDNAGANTATVPPNSTTAFNIGDEIELSQEGAGATTIVEGSGVTIDTPDTLVLNGQFSKVKLIKKAADVWQVNGDLTP